MSPSGPFSGAAVIAAAREAAERQTVALPADLRPVTAALVAALPTPTTPRSPAVTTAAVLSAPAFRITLPGGESHRIPAESETEARRVLRDRLEITRLPAGCVVVPWEGTGPVEAPEALEVPELPVAASGVQGSSSSSSSPAKKAGKGGAAWKSLPDAELAAYLLDHVTLGDTQWSHRAGGKSRRKGEKRDAFIRRVLLGEEAA